MKIEIKLLKFIIIEENFEDYAYNGLNFKNKKFKNMKCERIYSPNLKNNENKVFIDEFTLLRVRIKISCKNKEINLRTCYKKFPFFYFFEIA